MSGDNGIRCWACNAPILRLEDARKVKDKILCQDLEACVGRVNERDRQFAPRPGATASASGISTARDRYGWRSLPAGSRYLGPPRGK